MLNNKKNHDVNAIDHYVREYQRVEKELVGHEQKYLSQIRLDALEQFSTLGFPSKKHADWKYTSLTTIHQTPYFLAPKPCKLDATTMLNLPRADYRLVFVNGFFAAHLSSIAVLTDNSKITNLSTMLEQHPEQLKSTWKPNKAVEKNSFTHLNTAFMQDGAYIYLATNTRLNSPIEILFINTDATPHRFIPLRNIVIAEENSQAIIIEKYIDMTPENNTNYFLNTVTECRLAANSHIEHYKNITESKQAQHVDSLCVTQQKNSQFSAYSLVLSGSLIRSDVTVQQ